MSILSVVGKLTRGLRAGEERLIRHRPDFEGLPVSIQVTSPAFADGQPMPAKYTVSGEDVSPPLAWSNLPTGTRDLALVVEDYDISLPTPMVHLIAYHLDITASSLAEGALPSRDSAGVPSTASLGKNGLGFSRYDGPAPPPGHGTHHYVFQLFALGRRLEIAPHATRDTLLYGMKDHVLALGILTGTFERK
jgi:Raf kinase inhibitor-like YbhB/YbcL family protein